MMGYDTHSLIVVYRVPHVLGATVPSLSSHFTPTRSDPGSVASVDQVKKWALKGFDRPGFCFYVRSYS